MNKESTWSECVESNASILVSPDKAKARSLFETAVGRNQFLERNEVGESSANFIFEGYYASILEIIHALILLSGYNVNNHICLGYYLRDVLNRSGLFRMFDDCRFKRNSLIYYGRRMDFETAKATINKCKQLIEELKFLFEMKINKP